MSRASRSCFRHCRLRLKAHAAALYNPLLTCRAAHRRAALGRKPDHPAAMRMNKTLIPITIAAALALCACSSLPDGSKKPELAITSVQAAQNDGKAGFNVTCTLTHSSLEPLKIRRITTRVAVNGSPMASGEDTEKREVAPRQDVVITQFVPANLARPVSLETLGSPMINARANAEVKIYFVDDEESPFNPSATFNGKLTDAQP